MDKTKPRGSHEIIYECEVVTPAFIYAHSHIGMIRTGEPANEEEADERMNSVYPLNSTCIVYIPYVKKNKYD